MGWSHLSVSKGRGHCAEKTLLVRSIAGLRLTRFLEARPLGSAFDIVVSAFSVLFDGVLHLSSKTLLLYPRSVVAQRLGMGEAAGLDDPSCCLLRTTLLILNNLVQSSQLPCGFRSVYSSLSIHHASTSA